MYVLNQGLAKWEEIICRVGQVLAIVLVCQTAQSAAAVQFGSTVQQFPQVVLNGGSTTSFTIHNPDTEKTIDVDVRLYSPSGGALIDGQVELGPGETETVSFGDASAALTRGWAELKSDDEFIATEFFQLFLGGLKPRVGVLPSPAAEEIKFLGSSMSSSSRVWRFTTQVQLKPRKSPLVSRTMQGKNPSLKRNWHWPRFNRRPPS